ncbi:MAG: DoxX family protein [Myxococcota bacterium]
MLKTVLLYVMSAFYVFGGVMHFVKPGFYLAMMPPWLPWHRALVAISGVAEIALGLALLVPSLRPWAAWGLIALLIAVFPANVYAAMEGLKGYGGWARLPFQLVFVAWAWWYTRP